MGPQGCPLQFNLSERPSPRRPDLTTGGAAGGRRRAHFAGDERHDRFSGGRKPREKVAPLGECYRSRRCWPAGGPRISRRGWGPRPRSYVRLA